MRPNIQCDSTECWCRDEDYRVKWIPSLGISYTVEELSRDGHARVFRYVYIEEGTA